MKLLFRLRLRLLVVGLVLVFSGGATAKPLVLSRCEHGDCWNGYGLGQLAGFTAKVWWEGWWANGHPKGEGWVQTDARIPCTAKEDGVFNCYEDGNPYEGAMILTQVRPGSAGKIVDTKYVWLVRHGLGRMKGEVDGTFDEEGTYQYDRLFNGIQRRLVQGKTIVVVVSNGVPDEREWKEAVASALKQALHDSSNDKELAAMKGERSYRAYCAACHKPDMTGLVGPNLTDNSWLHGHRFEEIFWSLMNGIGTERVKQLPPKGPCPAYAQSLGPDGLIQIIRYLQATNKNIE